MDHNTDREDTAVYKVTMNHEEQYSIWPDYKSIPQGWTDAGRRGSKSECLAFIKEVWTDMKPLSLRKKDGGICQKSVSPAFFSCPNRFL